MSRKYVLLLGLEPSAVDFAAVPGMDEAKLVAGLDQGLAGVRAAGFDSDWCLFGMSWQPARAKIAAAIAARAPDAVMIGAGIRAIPAQLGLFEQIINLVHEAAPRARLCFNTSPGTTPEAVLRWLSP